jgi:hypothetical protein
MIVDTATLAHAAGMTPGMVRLAVLRGTIRPLGRLHAGQRGRPGMWFDLDTALDALTGVLDHGDSLCVNHHESGALGSTPTSTDLPPSPEADLGRSVEVG